MRIINKINFTGKDYTVQEVINTLQKYKHLDVVEDFEIAMCENDMSEDEKLVREAYSKHPNDKIGMIKYVRNAKNEIGVMTCSLREAKVIVDKYYDECADYSDGL